MINREQAEKLRARTIDDGECPEADNQNLIGKLKSLLSNLINSNGQTDAKALADVIDSANTTSDRSELRTHVCASSGHPETCLLLLANH